MMDNHPWLVKWYFYYARVFSVGLHKKGKKKKSCNFVRTGVTCTKKKKGNSRRAHSTYATSYTHHSAVLVYLLWRRSLRPHGFILFAQESATTPNLICTHGSISTPRRGPLTKWKEEKRSSCSPHYFPPPKSPGSPPFRYFRGFVNIDP